MKKICIFLSLIIFVNFLQPFRIIDGLNKKKYIFLKNIEEKVRLYSFDMDKINIYNINFYNTLNNKIKSYNCISVILIIFSTMTIIFIFLLILIYLNLKELYVKEKEIKKRLNFERIVAETSTRLIDSNNKDLGIELELTLDRIKEFSNAYSVCLYKYDKEQYQYSYCCNYGWYKDINSSVYIKNKEFIEKIKELNYVFFKSTNEIPQEMQELYDNFLKEGLKAIIIIPIIINNRLIGLMELKYKEVLKKIEVLDINLYKTITELLVNAYIRKEDEEYIKKRNEDILMLQEDIINTQKELIIKLGEIVETKSRETANHTKRVAEISYLLARLYGLPEEECNMLKYASPMHDIGKIGIAETILNKPEKLTEEERNIIKTHTQIGYDLLKYSNKSILRVAATIAYEHHEHWDGNGYPRNLKGEEISIYGRITCIADIFDALYSKRVYKRRWNLEEVLTYLNSERGKTFEPKLTDIFFQNIDKIIAIYNINKDN